MPETLGQKLYRTSLDMLTRWATPLQCFDITVQHKPGWRYVVPDTLWRLSFENKEDDRAPTLASICRNVPPADASILTSIIRRPFEFSSSNLSTTSNRYPAVANSLRHPCVQSAVPASSQLSTPQIWTITPRTVQRTLHIPPSSRLITAPKKKPSHDVSLLHQRWHYTWIVIARDPPEAPHVSRPYGDADITRGVGILHLPLSIMHCPVDIKRSNPRSV